MKSNHTQGEWAYDVNANKGFDIYLNGSIKVIANVLHKDVSYMPSKQEAEANARLIAAAPDMYDSLKEIKGLVGIDGKIAEIIKAALSKAEGNI